jgi:hypothetical protein
LPPPDTDASPLFEQPASAVSTPSAQTTTHPATGAPVALTATGDSESCAQLEGCIGFLDWGFARNVGIRPWAGKRNVINRTFTV